MTCVLDGAVFRDRKNRRCIALNSGLDHCLTLGEDGSQTFTLRSGDTNSVMSHDRGQAKVRTMATAFERGPAGTGFLPVLQSVWFEGRVEIGGNYARMGPTPPDSPYWWFVLAQLQHMPDGPTSPPISLNIEIVNGMEYFAVWISDDANPGGRKLPGPRVIVPRPSKTEARPFTYRFDYTDAQGGPDGRAKVTITEDGKPPVVICDYRGVTGSRSTVGLYPGWGIYGISKWRPKQLPLVMRFDALDWGVSPTATA